MKNLDPKVMAENERKELQDRYIRFDWAIKRLLRQKANFDVLNGFLTVMLREEVRILEILESESNQESADDKFNRVDIKALNSKGEIIIVEIQNTREVHYLERILYGVTKAITEHISLGEGYQKVKKVYSISILYFDLGVGTDYFYHGQNHFTGVHTGDRLRINMRDRDAVITRLPACRDFPRVHPDPCKRVRQSGHNPSGRMDRLPERRHDPSRHDCSRSS